MANLPAYFLKHVCVRTLNRQFKYLFNPCFTIKRNISLVSSACYSRKLFFYYCFRYFMIYLQFCVYVVKSVRSALFNSSVRYYNILHY